jgi:Tfp pilus assembly protein PilF
MISFSGIAQPTWTFDPFGKEKKPKEYEEKKLGSEKTADKKFTRLRRFIQNNVTHYNYYFNANNKINTVLEVAKAAQKDDYAKLLSFYPYSLDNTSQQATELDSVIYKATAGILLHDLRTDWVDNMYFLIGKAYYFRKTFDTASLTFQFINYNLFPRAKNEDDNRIVGANSSATLTKLSIADKEKRNIFKRIFSKPPSRNESLIWLARNYIDSDQFGESAGLINILQEDPNLPFRLKDDLDQVNAYWYFKQGNYDSAAVFLEKALTSADNKADLARWQYLLGQLYEMTGKFDKANKYFSIAGKRTVDPLMDIFAHLNNAKMLRDSGNSKALDESIAQLLKMAKRDKYEAYRDIIFHSAGILSMKKPDTMAAIAFYEKSLKVNESNAAYKNKVHLALGRIAYAQKQYKSAADHYDSLDIAEPALQLDSLEVAERKESLRKAANQLDIILLEDSLQMVASLPIVERDELLKKLVKKSRKDAGLKEVNFIDDANKLSSFSEDKNASTDLFKTPTKGEWYFYNASAKSKGFSSFKAKWGDRENSDNWRRKSASDAIVIDAIDPLAPADSSGAQSGQNLEISFESLLRSLPLTPEKLDSSNENIATALLTLAEIFQNELRDYEEAIYTYDIYLQRFPTRLKEGEVYLGLYYCYTKIQDLERAAYYKSLLDSSFSESISAKKINDPISLQPEKNNPAVSKKYQDIYNLFFQEKYDIAFELKKTADSLYGKQYWTPQLLFIESMYYVKCGYDSEAVNNLNTLIGLYPESPLAAKATALIDVLTRRKEIETYLNKLEVTRVEEDDKILIPTDQKIERKTIEADKKSEPKIKGLKSTVKMKDSALSMLPGTFEGVFKWQPDKPHFVVMILKEVDPVYVNEAKVAFQRFNSSNNFSAKNIAKDALDTKNNLLVFSSFENAEDATSYLDKIKKVAPTQISWLAASKYMFIIIHEDNLNKLKSNKELDTYKKLLNNQYPGKF